MSTSKPSRNQAQRMLRALSIQTFILIMKNYAEKQEIVKSLKHIGIYSVLSAHSGLGVALGTPFETLLEVKGVARSILETL